MTSPEMTDNNKDSKQQDKKTEQTNNVEKQTIPVEQDILDAIKFLNLKTNIDINDNINNNINKQKDNFKTILSTQFSDKAEIEKIIDPKVIEAYINIIDRVGSAELNTIKTNFTEQKTKSEIDKKVENILSSTIDPFQLFEQKDEKDTGANFNLVMEYLYGESTEALKITSASTGYEQQLLKLVQSYNPDDKITEITIGKAEKPINNSGGFAEQFLTGTWVIEYGPDGDKKYISRGTNEQLEENKAEQAAEDGDFDENVFALDFTPDTGEKGIAYFDKDMGYFAGFQKFITIQEEKTPGYVVQYLPRMMKEINTIQPKEKEEFVKNGYADVLTKYIIDNKNNPELLKTYLEGLNSQNLNLLGVDQATRTKNYNALFFADVQNKILHPEIQAYINGLDDTQKKAFAEKIGAIKLGIDGVEKTSSVETLKKAANGVLKMLLGLFQQLGIGKATLSRRFGEENVSKLFLEEYGLNDKIKAQAITNISKEMTEEKDKNKREATINAYKSGIFPSGGDIQKSFDKDKEKYITEITKEENAKYINPAVLKKCLDTYNKDNGTTLSILDIITTEKKDGKDIINTIKDPNNLKKIMTHYLDKDAVWTEIAAANKSIGSPTKIDTIVQTYNESGINIDTAIQKYCIIDNQDTARFLTASFFSDKHLESTITTNELHNGKEVVINNNNTKIDDEPAVELKEEKIVFKDGETLVNKDGIVTAAGGAKKIHEVIDMATAPDKIKVTRGTEKTIAVKKEINGTVTYIPESDKDKSNLTLENRIKINAGDKIEAIQKPDYLFQENNKKITEALNNITNNTYKKFDFTTFTYDKNAGGDQKEYQDNLLKPMSNILNDQEQFNLLFYKYATNPGNNKNQKEFGPINLKNTFLMMDNDNTTKAYNNLTDNITETAKIIPNNNEITITQDNGTITIKYEDKKITTKREVKAAT